MRGLCWWHETRLFEKLHPIFDYNQKTLDDFIGKVRDSYEELENYKKKPSQKFKEKLLSDFDDLFSTHTGYDVLDHRIKLTGKKKTASNGFYGLSPAPPSLPQIPCFWHLGGLREADLGRMDRFYFEKPLPYHALWVQNPLELGKNLAFCLS